LRLEIYGVAWAAGRDGITIGELVKRTGAKQSLVSFHVKKLVEVELLVRDWPAHRRSGFRVHGTTFADIHRWQTSLTNHPADFSPPPPIREWPREDD
jgi:DNA-binding transcriptional regulator GbsR (MarR family)